MLLFADFRAYVFAFLLEIRTFFLQKLVLPYEYPTILMHLKAWERNSIGLGRQIDVNKWQRRWGVE